MKVLLVNGQGFGGRPRGSFAGYPLTGPDIGGVPVYLATLAGALREQGCEVVHLHFDVPAARVRHDADGYVLPSRGRRLGWRERTVLTDILRAERPQVAHLHCVYYAISPWMLDAMQRHVPVVMTMHDVSSICYRRTKVRRDGCCCEAAVGVACIASGCYRPGEDGRLASDLLSIALNKLQLDAYRRIDRMVVPSAYLAHELALNGFDANRIDVVPHCVTRAGEAPSAVHKDVARILYVGRMIPEKGVVDLVRAFAAVGPGCELHLVGGGASLPAARDAARALGLAARVVFHGELPPDEVDEHYRRCDIVVMPSLGPEAFGLVGLEAMAFGKPIVAYGAGGVTEWLVDGITGYLVPRGNAEALAERMRRLLSDPDARARMGGAGRQAVAARYGADRHAAGIIGTYRRAMAARSAGRAA